MTEIGCDENAGLHCVIPITTGRVIGVAEFQKGYESCKNSKQRLRVTLRTLSSMGYLSGDFASLPHVRGFLEDYRP